MSPLRFSIFLAVALQFVAAVLADPSATKPVVDSERLVRVYVLLKDAEQMATVGIADSDEKLQTAARAMKFDELKKECGETVDRISKALTSAPASRRPETMGYLKNAMLRLSFDREEDFNGHVSWAKAKENRAKVPSYIRDYEKTIKDALAKI